MSDSPANDAARADNSGVWRGVGGCFLTAVSVVIGMGLGLWIGWLLMPPKWDPMRGGSEFHGLSVDFERLGYLVAGFVVGGLAGAITGATVSVILLRRRKPKAGTEKSNSASA